MGELGLAGLARRVERAQRSAGVVRYGSVVRIGAAEVVLNPDNPFTAGNFAAGLDCTPAEAAATLVALEELFAEAGREEAVVVASPSSLPELELVADEAGWFAAEEGEVLVHPGTRFTVTSYDVRSARTEDLPAVAGLLADAAGLSSPSGLLRHLGHRLDDPRTALLVAEHAGSVDGVACTFVEGGAGLLLHLVVRAERRRRGAGGALAAAALAALAAQQTRRVFTACEEGGSAEAFAEAVGFEFAYATTMLVRRVD